MMNRNLVSAALAYAPGASVAIRPFQEKTTIGLKDKSQENKNKFVLFIYDHVRELYLSGQRLK